MSALEDLLLFQIKATKLPMPEREVQLFPPRRWRYDFVWRKGQVIMEVDGGTWVRGAHSRGTGQRRDCQKQNVAMLNQWRVFRFTSDMIKSGEAIQILEQVMRWGPIAEDW